jgi:hypothetical protein
VGAQANVFFGAGAHSVAGVRDALRAVGAETGSASTAGRLVGGDSGPVWCELGLRAVLWRNTPVFRIVCTRVASGVRMSS